MRGEVQGQLPDHISGDTFPCPDAYRRYTHSIQLEVWSLFREMVQDTLRSGEMSVDKRRAG
jgi:hypothetical protein